MTIEAFFLSQNDWVPNHPRLPVIVYRRAILAGDPEETARAFEAAFDRNGWPPQWRDGVYDYHHYHSTAHEVLGIAGGTATLTIGGPGGRDLSFAAGDALLFPAGTGHRRVSVTKDLLVVGAYPEGQDWDICRGSPSAATLKTIRALAVPALDPLSGANGPLAAHWR